MAHIHIITYAEYETNKSLMTPNDKILHESFRYENKEQLNDVQQIIASLKCIIPSEADLSPRSDEGKMPLERAYDLDRYETIAKERMIPSPFVSDDYLRSRLALPFGKPLVPSAPFNKPFNRSISFGQLPAVMSMMK